MAGGDIVLMDINVGYIFTNNMFLRNDYPKSHRVLKGSVTLDASQTCLFRSSSTSNGFKRALTYWLISRCRGLWYRCSRSQAF